MLKAKVNGDVLVVTSELNYADLKKVGPIAVLDDKKETLLCSVSAGAKGTGSACGTGITFDYPNADGKACVNLKVPAGENVKESVAAAYGSAFAAYNEYEDQLQDQIAAKKAAHKAIIDGIEVA